MPTILITRPESQAKQLAQKIINSGNKALIIPVIAIKPKPLNTDEITTLSKLTTFDLAVFISANAVELSLPLISQYANLKILQKLTTVAIGPATKQILLAYNITNSIISTNGFNSEGLLKHPQLQNLNGKKIVIFKGVGGRELLAATLANRGANVSSIATYTRQITDSNMIELQHLLLHNKITAIVVMSNESLKNLCTKVGAEYLPCLQVVQLVTISNRTAQMAISLGFKLSAIIASDPSDTAIYNCLLKRFLK